LQTAARARGSSLYTLAFSFLLSLGYSKGPFSAAFRKGHAKGENAVSAPFAEHVTGKACGQVRILLQENSCSSVAQ
jgi:hypothetical protein